MAYNSTIVRHAVRAEILHLTRQIESLQSLYPNGNFKTHRIAGSVTTQTSAIYGRKLNHTVGLGMSGPVAKDDILAIEQIYASTGFPPELDMCEYADPSVFALLTPSYDVTMTVHTFQRPLEEFDTEIELQGSNSEVEVAITTDSDGFAKASAEGFASNGRSAELLSMLARSAAHRSDTKVFFADVGGELAGSAGMSIYDIEDGPKLAVLFIDSTLPRFRGKGVHRALILARLTAAKNAECEFALAAARSGSVSARNIEKAGFTKIFKTLTYSKRAASSSDA